MSDFGVGTLCRYFHFFAFFFDRVDLYLVLYTFMVVLLGILLTHAFRSVAVQYRWMELPFERAVFYFSFGIIFCAVLDAAVLTAFRLLFSPVGESMVPSFMYSFLQQSAILTLWAAIYFTWHYVEKSRNVQLDKLKLEATVRTLELKTIKAQLNPHFIFNALNSIRALVDENPQRARTAITELSNILRSSMQVEKVEMVSLENELNIVRDYLALEHIRFEERLKIQYDIDPETLELPIPPMMLQTLVENAIKHGISREIRGGVISVASHLKDNTQHELTIRNTGQIRERLSNGGGFGLQSTRARLEILFGKRASFEIRNLDAQTVEAKVLMPLF
ncbi:histidine kinase [Chitinophaga sedimenti]|uniref:sensor histidine kinase n=1 Tax=Chitinophaga sedimenti TaxID=2033606 RepID=UPI002005E344|nr:histidine kinase [Chitinophaga sedimenti]MCK7559028.1 histidine kinase [Chitinophaga sedimenti]